MKNLKKLLKKHSGRSAGGMITVRSQGGRHKRYYREIDFKRNKFGVLGEVVGLEYDPNRNVEIALIKYKDGEFRYILSPKELKLGDKVVSDDKAEIKVGNAMKLKNITIGTLVHNIEITPGKGGQMVKSAGSGAVVQGKEENHILIKLPSGELRRFLPAFYPPLIKKFLKSRLRQ